MKQDFLIELTQDSNVSLSHHGILGQKWGIRRFQNPDGSLTEEGRRRYQKMVNRYEADTRRKVNENYNKNVEDAIKTSGWQTDTWLDGTRSMTQLYTNGRLGEHDIDFTTSSGTIDYRQRNMDEALTPDKILQIDATKKRCEKEYKKVLSTIRESVAKQYYDNRPSDDSYTLPGMGITRSGLKDGLIPCSITISTKNPEHIRMDIRNSDGGGLADFLVSYDINKDKVYDIQYAD